MRPIAIWAKERLNAQATEGGPRSNDAPPRRPVPMVVLVVLGWVSIVLGVLVFLAYYTFGYFLGGAMVFTGGVFWAPLALAVLGAGLVVFARP